MWKILRTRCVGNRVRQVVNERRHQLLQQTEWKRSYSVRQYNVEQDYRIGGLLGTGTFASVFEAKSKQDGKLYALKSVPKHSAPGYDPLKEATHLDRIHHVNVASLEALYEDSSHYHLVTELCCGGELFERIIRKGKYSESSAIRVVTQIMQGLSACHASGVVHRDVKPENILCKSHADVCILSLTDFGSSESFVVGEELHDFVGSATYVAPEVLKGSYNEKCDIWSVGVVAYMLLCGRSPWKGDSSRQIALSVLRDEIDLESPPWGSISDTGKQFVASLLERDPALRPSAEQVLQHPWLNTTVDQMRVMQEATAMSNLMHEQRASRNFEHSMFAMPSEIADSDLRSTSFPLLEAVNNILELQRESKLRRLAIQVAALSLNHEASNNPADELRYLFKAKDVNNEGIISLRDVSSVIEEVSKGDVIKGHAAFKAQLDKANNANGGRVDIDEFVAACISQRMQLRKRDKINLFNSFDINKDGRISIAELMAAAPHLTTLELRDIVEFADVDRDGEISYLEFVSALNHHHTESMEWVLELLKSGGGAPASELVDNATKVVSNKLPHNRLAEPAISSVYTISSLDLPGIREDASRQEHTIQL